MQGIMMFTGGEKLQLVGKVKEFPSKEEFKKECIREYAGIISTVIKDEEVSEGVVRYYPHGTEDSNHEFGNDGVYLFTDKLTPGAFKVWVIDTK